MKKYSVIQMKNNYVYFKDVFYEYDEALKYMDECINNDNIKNNYEVHTENKDIKCIFDCNYYLGKLLISKYFVVEYNDCE